LQNSFDFFSNEVNKSEMGEKIQCEKDNKEVAK